MRPQVRIDGSQSSNGGLGMRPSCDEASRARSRLRSQCRERPNCAAPVCVRCVLRHEAGQADDPDQTQPEESDRRRAGVRSREGERASSTATATVGEDERDGGRAGKCGVERRVRADKAVHILANTAMAGSKTSKP